MKGFDSADVCYILDYSFLEANRAIIIDVCYRVWIHIRARASSAFASSD
jgi:hypothetical protein